jgi:hypothetical protein
MPWIILLPILALAGGGAWWYEKHKTAATPTPGSVAAAAASQPVGATYQPPPGAGMGLIASPLAAHLGIPPLMGGTTAHPLLGMTSALGTAAQAAAVQARLQGQKIQIEANNLMTQIPGQIPADPTGLYVQIIQASLRALYANPTPAQLQQTISALIQTGNQYAVNIASILKTWSPTI